ncbi:MAG: hypothetical protein ABIT37_04020, partial [Luteolibacter sp.]
IASNVIAATAGTLHSLFLKTDGTLWAMGDNAYGQLGEGTNADRLTPVQIASQVVAAAAGQYFSVFLKTDGTLWTAGDNTNGQLGDGTTIRRYAPVQVASGVTRIAAGLQHGHFIKSDGSLWSMGNNGSGRLGDTTTTSRYLPVQVATNVASVSGGSSHSLFVKTDGTLLAMGLNSSYQLGDGTTTSRSTPIQAAIHVSAASAGGSHSLWLTSDSGTAVTAIASHPSSGFVAPGGTAQLSVAAVGGAPISYQWYAGLTGDVTQPIGGATSSAFTTPPLAASANYWVRTTGSSGSADSRAARIAVISPPSIVTQPAVVGNLPGRGVRLTVAGSAEIFSYQWFTGSPGDVSHPVAGATTAAILTLPVKSTTSFWVRLTNPAGSADSAAVIASPAPAAGRYLKAAGATFGSSLYQLAGAVSAAVTGPSHSLFVKTSGTLWAVGSNSSGQLGDGTYNNASSPVKISDNVATAAAGTNHSLFVKTDGTLWAMGGNSSGQLGDGTITTKLTPVLVASNVASATAGDSFSLFVKTDGTLWAMGSNASGKLGDGTTTSRTLPVQIATDVVMAAAGGSHGLFVKTDGSLWGMGSNSSYGQLGAGSSVYSVKSPVKMADGVVSIAAGQYHSLFVTSDGTLWSVGKNDYGQLGYGSVDSQWNSSSFFKSLLANPPLPHPVAAGVTAAAAGANHSLWTKTDGSLWSSGYNNRGQLCANSSSSTLKPPAMAQSLVALAAADGDNSVILTTSSALEPPAIVTHPASTIVPSGSAATFTVTATGGGTLSYQWYSGKTGDTSSSISGATSATYLSPPLTAAKDVWVRISNTAAYAESRTATAVIGTASTAYQNWAAGQGLEGVDLSPTADPDGDFRNNLLEYATGSTSGTSDAPPPATAILNTAANRAEFRLQLRADPGLLLTCLLTPDMISWEPVDLYFSGGIWTTSSPTLQVIATTPGDGNLWNLTLSHPGTPDRLFLKTAASMISGN